MIGKKLYPAGTGRGPEALGGRSLKESWLTPFEVRDPNLPPVKVLF